VSQTWISIRNNSNHRPVPNSAEFRTNIDIWLKISLVSSYINNIRRLLLAAEPTSPTKYNKQST